MAATATLTETTVAPLVPSRLDELLTKDASTLKHLYETARAPLLADVRGALRGRMLAWPRVGGVTGRALRALASSSRFPWRGKSFSPLGATDGEGINRVVLERVKLFRFETSIGPSRAGDFDALQLDYDLPENPWFIRRIKDEMRELSPGLWLGQAYWHTPRADHLVLYFGLTSA